MGGEVLRLFRSARLPDPIPNHPVDVDGERRVLDFAWPESNVAVEFDGFVPHTTRRGFNHDRERQNLLVDSGYRLTVSARAIGAIDWCGGRRTLVAVSRYTRQPAMERLRARQLPIARRSSTRRSG